MGYAAAMAWVLFVIIFVLSMISMRFSLRHVYYE
jgi:multiple sugar transport system permease protein